MKIVLQPIWREANMFNNFMAIAALLACLVGVPSAQAQDSAVWSAEHHVDLAVYYSRLGRTADAVLELEAALNTPDGKQNAEIWFMLAKLHWKHGDVARAQDAADMAVSLSTGDQQEQAISLATYLHDEFGAVLITTHHTGTRTRLSLELKSMILDAGAKRYFLAMQEQMAEAHALPYVLILPVGDYRIQSRKVSVVSDTQVVLLLTGKRRR